MELKRIHSPSQRLKKETSTAEERKALLSSFLQINICITRREYIQLTKLTSYSAMIELNDFISQGILRRRGSGKSAVYVAGENL